jgi:hypothetical protein
LQNEIQATVVFVTWAKTHFGSRAGCDLVHRNVLLCQRDDFADPLVAAILDDVEPTG